MQFTLFTDYSLRSLVFIALKTAEKDSLTTIKDISSELQISNNHIVKVIHNLSKNGFIVTTRGNHGGVRLSRNPEEINLGDVVSSTENFSCLLRCAHNDCCFHSVCLFQGIMHKAATAFITELTKFTLADLLREKERLKQALAVSLEGDGETRICSLLTIEAGTCQNEEVAETVDASDVP